MRTRRNARRCRGICNYEGTMRRRDNCKNHLLKMALPLINDTGQSLGAIWLIKDLCRDAISHYTLRRVEHLRRSVLGSLEVLMVR